MRFTYDDEADALYIHLREDVRVVRSSIVDEGRVVDYGPDDRPVGIEILGASAGVELSDLAGPLDLGDFKERFDVIEHMEFRAVQSA